MKNLQIDELITVIVPTYNVEKYIDECLTSILDQTYENIEIIVVDDCSSDNTFEIIKKYQNKDSRIKILRNEVNKGVSYSRNVGLDNMNGKYVCFVDGDDIIDKYQIEYLYRLIKTNLCKMAYIGGISFHDNNISKDFHNKFVHEFMNIDKFFEMFILNKVSCAATRYLYLVDEIRKCDISFREGTFEDYKFNFDYINHLFFIGETKIGYCKNKTYFYRKHPGSITAKGTNYSLVNVIDIYNQTLRLLNNKKYKKMYKLAMHKSASNFIYELYDTTKKRHLSIDKNLINIVLNYYRDNNGIYPYLTLHFTLKQKLVFFRNYILYHYLKHDLLKED